MYVQCYNVMKSLINIISIMFILYIPVSFIELNLDFNEWNNGSRIVYVSMITICLLLNYFISKKL